MSKPLVHKQRWAKYRLPIILALIALSLYVFSIVWLIYGGRGAA